ncbi:integrase family protein [Paracoccus marcusii]|uniref:integrase family protein n=1 Tax=Paracoccus marcusii TaxID=59779 RepID=UPI0037369F90
MGKRQSNLLGQKFIEKVLRGQAPDGRHADGGNLYCIVRGNSASWVFRRTVRNKHEQHTIASVRKLADLAVSNDVGKRASASLQNARLIAAEYRANIAKGKPVKAIITNDYPTLDEILAYYCKVKKIDVKDTNSHVAPFLSVYKDHGRIFSKAMGVAYRDKLINEKKAWNTVNNYMGMIKVMFKAYIADHSTDIVNPMTGVNLPKTDDAIGDRNPMPHDVIKKVYDSLEGDYKRLWIGLVVTGARFNEIKGIKSKDLADGFVNIEANDRRRLKNKASKRIIPFMPKYPKKRTEYYFDEMTSVSAVSQVFQRKINKHISKELVGARKITSHSLRHSLTDWFRLKGVQQNIEDLFLGHAAKDVSNRVYGSVDGRKAALEQHLVPVLTEYLKKLGIDLQ